MMPIIVITQSEFASPIKRNRTGKRVWALIAPSIPRLVVMPDMVGKYLLGSHSLAVFITATNAKADPNPIKKRPSTVNSKT